MRSPGSGALRRASWAGLVLAAAGSILAPAASRAEAPFFYDDLFDAAFYDSTFVPANRPVGFLTGALQAWSVPDRPSQNAGDQSYFGEYRVRWVTPLEAKSALLVELKGAARTEIVRDDYVVKSEFIYRGLEAPAWIYGGLRIPEESDFLVYGGVESMSFQAQDLFKNVEESIPVAGKGYAEVRWDMDDSNPSLRLVALPHTVPGRLGPATVAAPFEVFFQEGVRPLWLFTPHLDVNVLAGFVRVDLTSGYAIELRDGGEQRFAAGIQASFGSTGL